MYKRQALNGGSTGYNVGVKAAQKIFSSLDDLSRLAPESNTVVTACYISDVKMCIRDRDMTLR